MLRRVVYAMLSVAALLGGCEKSSRTKNSAGSSSLVDELESTRVPVYTFVSAEQSLSDARGAYAAEKWGEAQAAAQALLEKQPENAEARSLRERAKLEQQNQGLFARFNKAAASTDGFAMAKAWREISDESIYKDRGRPEFDRVKTKFLATQQNEIERLARVGRCDDARRLARNNADYFPDVREALEAIPVGCKTPAREDRPRTEVASIKDKIEVASAQLPAAEPPPSAPEPAAAAPTPSPVRTAMLVDSAPPPAKVMPKKIVASELEPLRIAGERFPTLPAGAKNIARRDSVTSFQVVAEVCVSDSGVPSSVKLVRASEYNDANEKILSDIRKWRFRPYLVDGKPSPVCTPVILRYSIE